jgi:hypothetical protein
VKEKSIDTRKEVILVGTSHDIQKDLVNDVFKEYIRELIVENDIKLIAEEIEVKVNTIGIKLSKELSIKHLIIEPTPEEKIDLDIEEVHKIKYDLMSKYELKAFNIDALKSDVFDVFMEYKERVENTYRQREKIWFERIIQVNTYPVLVICGACHFDAFSELLESKTLSARKEISSWGINGDKICI